MKVICIKEVSSSVSSFPPKIKAGQEYHVTGVYNHPLFGEYFFLAEDLPTQACAVELFAPCNGPDEREILEQRADAELIGSFAPFDKEAHDRIWEKIEALMNQSGL